MSSHKNGAEATHIWKDVVARHRKVFGPKHKSTLSATFSLAVSHRREQNWIDARRAYQDTYDGRRENLGPLAGGTLDALDAFAGCCYVLKDYYTACDAY
jgi:hypothetical protein